MRPGLSQVFKAPPAGVPYASRKRTRRSSAPRAFAGVQGAGSDSHHALCRCPATGCQHAVRALVLAGARHAWVRAAPGHDSGRLLRDRVLSFWLTCYATGLMLRTSARGCAQTQPCRALSALRVSMCTRVRMRSLADCRQCVSVVDAAECAHDICAPALLCWLAAVWQDGRRALCSMSVLLLDARAKVTALQKLPGTVHALPRTNL